MQKMRLGGRLPGRNVVPGLMTYFSELGYGSRPDLVDNNQRFAETGNPLAPPTVYHRRLADEHRQALQESGFDKVYPDLKKFCLDQQQIHGTANRRMIEAVRGRPFECSEREPRPFNCIPTRLASAGSRRAANSR
ncbi:MAG: hypothetical protein A2Y76_04030 [Planctomycetes bacterium RBG_13_60_9]|nr:MAG: hypothetical protein A2Y76_04030 [Planctomycetes bacterium RBG_13_60_9]